MKKKLNCGIPWSKVSVKKVLTFLLALMFFVSMPIEALAANFNPSNKDLRNARNWWTPDFGTAYIAGTTNGSVAYYHYYVDDYSWGSYDFYTWNYPTPMEGAIYQEGGIFSGPKQRAYDCSSMTDGALRMEMSLMPGDYYFALGGMGRSSGDYVFCVEPHQDFAEDYYKNGDWHGKIWERTDGYLWDAYDWSIQKIYYFSPADLEKVYFFLVNAHMKAVWKKYDAGWDIYQAVQTVLDGLSLYVNMPDAVDFIAFFATNIFEDTVYGEYEEIESLTAKLTKGIYEKCRPYYYDYHYRFQEYCKITQKYTVNTWPRNDYTVERCSWHFSGPERSRGQWVLVE